MNNLAGLYQFEEKNIPEAKKWLLRAAEKDLTNSMFNLAVLY